MRQIKKIDSLSLKTRILFIYFLCLADAPPFDSARPRSSARAIATHLESNRIFFATELIDNAAAFNCFSSPCHHSGPHKFENQITKDAVEESTRLGSNYSENLMFSGSLKSKGRAAFRASRSTVLLGFCLASTIL